MLASLFLRFLYITIRPIFTLSEEEGPSSSTLLFSLMLIVFFLVFFLVFLPVLPLYFSNR
jgi:hypothetical protein